MFDPDVFLVPGSRRSVCASDIIRRQQHIINLRSDLFPLDSAGYNEYYKRVHYLGLGVINHRRLNALATIF